MNKEVIIDTKEGLKFFQNIVDLFLTDIEENSKKDEFLIKVHIDNKVFKFDMCANFADCISSGLKPLNYSNIHCETCLDKEFEGLVNKISYSSQTWSGGLKEIITLYNKLNRCEDIRIEIYNRTIIIPKEQKHFLWCLKDGLLNEIHDYVPIS